MYIIPIITFPHHKGGTGKTTSCLNISGYLQKMGCNVLIVDIDPQANATSGLGVDPNSLKFSMYDVFMKGFEGYPETDIKDVIIQTQSGIDLAPSTLDLVGVEPFLYQINNRSHILKNVLQTLKSEYDFILIDTPPSMGQFVINGLVASDYTIVTFDRGIFALNGLKSLLTIFADIEEQIGEKITTDMAIITKWLPSDMTPVSGLKSLIYRISFKKRYQGEVEGQMLMGEFEKEVQQYFDSIYRIPYSWEIFKAQKAGLPLSHFSPKCEAAEAYEKIAQDVFSWKERGS